MSGEDVQIKSPDFIADSITGEKREVDISLRGKIGSHPILIIIEVRDRDKVQDVTWIEQLATKRDNIGADKAIAVSTHGFSRGAIRKARAYGIELRTIEEITQEKVKRWMFIDTLKDVIENFNINKAIIHPINREHAEKLTEFLESRMFEVNLNEKILFPPGQENALSLNELFRLFSEIKTVYRDLTPGKTISIQSTIHSEDNVYYKIITKEGEILVDTIIIDADLWVELKNKKIQSIKEYKTSEKTFARVIILDNTATSGEPHQIHLVRIFRETGDDI